MIIILILITVFLIRFFIKYRHKIKNLNTVKWSPLREMCYLLYSFVFYSLVFVMFYPVMDYSDSLILIPLGFTTFFYLLDIALTYLIKNQKKLFVVQNIVLFFVLIIVLNETGVLFYLGLDFYL